MQPLTIELTDYLTLGGDSQYKLLDDGVSGLEKPPIRSSGGSFAGADGGYTSGQNYDVRAITIPGAYLGTDVDDAVTLRKALNALPIRTLITVVITLPNGEQYTTAGYVYDLKNILINATRGRFQLLLTCPDPFLYALGAGDDGWISQAFYKSGGGGYPTAYTLPVAWSPGHTLTTVNNDSGIYYLPQLILNGQFTNPKIINQTTNAVFQLDVTTAPGQEIVIDMLNRTVTLDGGSITSYKTDESSWWALYPGNNVIVLQTDSGGDDEAGTIRWRQGVEGI